MRLRGGLEISIDDLSDAVRITTARHGSRGTGLQIGDQRDAFFAVPRTLDRASPPSRISSRSFAAVPGDSILK